MAFCLLPRLARACFGPLRSLCLLNNSGARSRSRGRRWFWTLMRRPPCFSHTRNAHSKLLAPAYRGALMHHCTQPKVLGGVLAVSRQSLFSFCGSHMGLVSRFEVDLASSPCSLMAVGMHTTFSISSHPSKNTFVHNCSWMGETGDKGTRDRCKRTQEHCGVGGKCVRPSIVPNEAAAVEPPLWEHGEPRCRANYVDILTKRASVGMIMSSFTISIY